MKIVFRPTYLHSSSNVDYYYSLNSDENNKCQLEKNISDNVLIYASEKHKHSIDIALLMFDQRKIEVDDTLEGAPKFQVRHSLELHISGSLTEVNGEKTLRAKLRYRFDGDNYITSKADISLTYPRTLHFRDDNKEVYILLVVSVSRDLVCNFSHEDIRGLPVAEPMTVMEH